MVASRTAGRAFQPKRRVSHAARGTAVSATTSVIAMDRPSGETRAAAILVRPHSSVETKICPTRQF